ncbi:hypothetical protein HPB50_020698 [Hyalomma asiaticum]|uniref:Uncharacterized protein n=1 Tax=Hyalomma asiaticum TaxID=266040 RepID=A0ACB7S2Q3_HYAAI|nr:hypothetical protein HPB50_020698 [Hyalomma asiaticum]
MFNATASSGMAHTTSSSTSAGRAIAGNVSDEDGADTEALKDSMAFPLRLARSCSGALYTTCSTARREYRYSRSLNACVEAGAMDATGMFLVCNRSPNRFSSVEVCERRCVLSERLEDECLEQPLFTACARQDVKSVWWFFDSKSCKRWDFPKGGCPENNGSLAIFSSEGECTRRCTNTRYPPCLKPSSVPCDTKILKFPAFAYVSADDGRVRCITTLASKPRTFRCLEGSNRYHSKAACQRACQGNVGANITTPSRIWRRNGS